MDAISRTAFAGKRAPTGLPSAANPGHSPQSIVGVSLLANAYRQPPWMQSDPAPALFTRFEDYEFRRRGHLLDPSKQSGELAVIPQMTVADDVQRAAGDEG
jgi:hypothetical protein